MIPKEEELNYLKMDAMQRSALFANKLVSMSEKELNDKANRQMLTDLYNNVVKSGAAFIQFMTDTQDDHKKKNA